ncbi:MAG: methyltransferase [Candidatus Dormibacteria bacterium]
MATTTAAPPNQIIWNLANTVCATRALYSIAAVGVADHLDDEPLTPEALGQSCDVNADALGRIIDLLSTYGIFAVSEHGISHTDASRLLRTDHPQSMRAFARLNGLPGLWRSLGAMDHSLRTGAPGWQIVDARGFFAYLQEHPDEGAVFEEAMTAKARFDIGSIITAYDFKPYQTIIDVAGGRGHLLQAVLETAPDARGVLFELPDVANTVTVENGRLRVQSGDFFTDPLPHGDLYMLMEIIHDWADAECIRILQGVRAAADRGASLIVIEDIAPDDGIDWRSQTMDVLMLNVTGGRQRSGRQHADLLRQAGFRCTRVVETSGPMRIVEAVAV